MPGLSRAATNLPPFMQDGDGRDKPGDDAKPLKMRSSGLNSGDFHHQIGQPLGGIQPADAARGGGHRGQFFGFGGEGGDFRGQPSLA